MRHHIRVWESRYGTRLVQTELHCNLKPDLHASCAATKMALGLKVDARDGSGMPNAEHLVLSECPLIISACACALRLPSVCDLPPPPTSSPCPAQLTEQVAATSCPCPAPAPHLPFPCLHCCPPAFHFPPLPPPCPAQLTEQNPELGAMLNDPAILRQSMALASNPVSTALSVWTPPAKQKSGSTASFINTGPHTKISAVFTLSPFCRCCRL